jgi:hypothetical protein
VLLALGHDLADRVEIQLAMLVIGLGAPADVVDAIGDDQEGRAAVENVAREAFESARGGVAAPAGVDEAHLALRIAQERVGFDDAATGAFGGDGVAEEYDRVAVAEGRNPRDSRPRRRAAPERRAPGRCP